MAIISGGTGGTTLGNVTAVTGTPSAGQGIRATSATAADWETLPGTELAYVSFATTTTVSATTSAAAQAIVSAGAVTFDGTAIMVEYFGPYHGCVATATLHVDLFLDTVFVAVLGDLNFTTAGVSSLYQAYRTTPAAGAHTYEIRMHRVTANWTVDAAAGSGYLPGFIRITKA